MVSMLILALQAVAPPDIPPRKPCQPASEGKEVVVCGRADQEQYRLRPLPQKYQKPPDGPGMGFDLCGGKKLNVFTSSEAALNGQLDKRVMIKLRLPF